MRGQCHIPVDKKVCGNFRYKCPVDVSSGMVLSSPCRVNWYKVKALIVQLFPDASKSGTPVPAKVTFGHALFRRKWAMEVVTTTFLPCADTSEMGMRPETPTKSRKHKQEHALQKITAKTTSIARTWQLCFASSGVERMKMLSQLLQAALFGPDTWPTGQASHTPLPAAAKVPPGQTSQAQEPGEETVPGRQSEQLLLPVKENFPVTQLWHLLLPAMEKVPPWTGLTCKRCFGKTASIAWATASTGLI